MDIKLESEDANFTFPEVVRGASVSSNSSSSSSNGNNNGIEGNKVTGGTRSGNSDTTPNGTIGSNGLPTRAVNANGGVGRAVGVARPRPAMGVYTKRAPPAHQGPVTLTSQLCTFSWHEWPFFIHINSPIPVFFSLEIC